MIRRQALSDSPRAMLVASTGGHLAQLMRLEPWWREHERTWVTFDKADARFHLQHESDVVHAHHPTTRNLPNAARNVLLAYRLMRSRRPDIVVSTGAGVALPFFLAARMLGVPTVYIEVYDRVRTRTLTGRLCRHLSTSFLVQWPGQMDLYPGSTLVGPLL